MISYGISDEHTAIIKPFHNSYPVEIYQVARAFGINTFTATMPDDISGSIQLDEKDGGASGYALSVNNTHHANRQRFTAAHEIAHFLLHQDKIGDGISDSIMYRSAAMNTQDEIEANKLAAALLMPANLIDQATLDGTGKVVDVARKLVVSEQALRIRIGIPA
ncbi:MAG: ImmA/IrrE family metallo-endopeptidase [Ghiorsea sp.]